MHHKSTERFNAEHKAGAYLPRLGYVGEQSPDILDSCIIAISTHLAMPPQQQKDNSTHHPAARSSPQPPPSTDPLIDLLFSLSTLQPSLLRDR